MSTNGILNINKPSGMTSFDVVAIVRKLTKEKKVGHAGTLDPAATGVLPVCIGQATKVIEHLTGTSKSYCAKITLGAVTDTYDAEGKVLRTYPTDTIDRSRVETALHSFKGNIEQIPPMFSAIKVSGKKLYELARAGLEIERAPRAIEIYEIQLLDWAPPSFTIKVDCSKGTYIRSLAHDIGTLLGCGAFLKQLVRLRTGPFSIGQAITIDQLRESFALSYWQTQLYNPDEVLLDWPAAIVCEEKEKAIRQGKNVQLGSGQYIFDGSQPNQSPGEGKCRAYSARGTLIALLRMDLNEMLWHPEKVFTLPDSD